MSKSDVIVSVRSMAQWLPSGRKVCPDFVLLRQKGMGMDENMNYEIIIRLGTKEDAYGITKLYFEGTGRVLSRPNLRIDLEDLPSVVAVYGSEIVGFAYLCDFSFGVVRLDNLYVKDCLRSQGIGRKMLEFLEKHMPEEHQYLILDNSIKYVYPNGAPKKSARVFYERLGFKAIVLIQNEKGEDITSVMLKKIHD